jgi:hypothetical protein
VYDVGHPHRRIARGAHGLPKAGVLNLLLTTSYYSIFRLIRIYQLKYCIYRTVFIARTVLYLLYLLCCTYYTVLTVLYLLYYIVLTVLVFIQYMTLQ